MLRRSSALLLVSGILPALCCSQGGQPATPPASTQQSSSTAGGPAAPAPGKNEKTKKVWTNDEVGSLQGTVSVVGADRPAERQPQSRQNGSSVAADVRRGKILRYRAAIAELQKKIEAADRRIAEFKNFKAEDSSPSGGINPNRGYSMVPTDVQVKQLEEKKKQLLGNIEDLENQAKKEGIEPGELR